MIWAKLGFTICVIWFLQVLSFSKIVWHYFHLLFCSETQHMGNDRAILNQSIQWNKICVHKIQGRGVREAKAHLPACQPPVVVEDILQERVFKVKFLNIWLSHFIITTRDFDYIFDLILGLPASTWLLWQFSLKCGNGNPMNMPFTLEPMENLGTSALDQHFGASLKRIQLLDEKR